MTMQYIVQ